MWLLVLLSVLSLANGQSIDCGTHTMNAGDTLVIESSRHPLKYPKNHECTWDITCSDVNSNIAFDCSLFELQNSYGCSKDYLDISDGTGLIEKTCAKRSPTDILTSDNTLSLEFVTNGDTTRKSGFSCTATCIVATTTTTVTPTTTTTSAIPTTTTTTPVPTTTTTTPIPTTTTTTTPVSTTTTTTPIPTTTTTTTPTTTTPPTTTPGPLSCGTHTMDVGDVYTIESNRHPLKYPPNHECVWDITCSQSLANIEFDCSLFEVQNSYGCKKDYLSISDGSGLIGKKCAQNAPTGVVTSDNTLSLKFVTNGDKTRKSGFSCTATCIGVTTTTTIIPTTTTTTTPTTTTPIPTTTTTTATPTTTTTTPIPTTTTTTPTTTTITTTPLPTTTTTTPLPTTTTTTATPTTTTTKPLPTTTTTTPPPTTTTTTPIITTTTPIPTTTTTATPTTTTPPTTTPGPLPCGTHTMDVGDVYTIKSMGHPLKYPPNHECIWDITCSQSSANIEFDCSSFEVQNSYGCKKDYLTISDGSGFIQKKCAVNAPSGIVTSDNTLSLKFVTNGDNTRRSGFSCTAKCVGSTSTTSVPTTTAPTTTTIPPSTTTTAPPTTTTTITAPPTTSTSPTTTTTTTSEASTTTADPVALYRLPCECGKVTSPKGNWHDLHNHPWTVALLDNSNSHFCSGTIINTYYILTAKNCVPGRGTAFKIRANEHELGTGLPRDITRNPTSVVFNGDLALVKMDTAISLTQYDAVKPACLPNSNKDFVGDDATHSGYDHGKCMKNDGSWTSESGNRLTFRPGPGAHAYCREDLGGPIVTEEGGKNFLAGIALDQSCSTTAQPSAKVSDYYQWIMDNSNTGRFCQR